MSPARRCFEDCRQRALNSLCDLVALFGRWVALPADLGQSQRERLYTPERTFWLFLAQALDRDPSCRNAVQRFLAWLGAVEGRAASPRTGSFCKARARLAQKALEVVHFRVLRRLRALEPPAKTRWRGRRVRVVDGSSVSLPDTEANQGAYPQPAGQKAGCGFPVVRLVVLFSLETGFWLRTALGTLATSEHALFHRLEASLHRGEVLLGDRLFGTYAHLALLQGRGVDVVARQHARRHSERNVLKRWGKHERLVRWVRGSKRPAWLCRRRWHRLPEHLDVRQITVPVEIPGFRTRTVVLVTTLLDRRRFPAGAFAELYRRRWYAELFLRDIKITLGLDPLRGRTPEMVRKELTIYPLAYNLVRGLMLEAASAHGVSPLRLSFAAACAVVRQWAPVLALPGVDTSRHQALHPLLLLALARDALPDRPDRCEPRARKRRPKNYALLTQPRHQFKETPHRNHYHKA